MRDGETTGSRRSQRWAAETLFSVAAGVQAGGGATGIPSTVHSSLTKDIVHGLAQGKDSPSRPPGRKPPFYPEVGHCQQSWSPQLY